MIEFSGDAIEQLRNIGKMIGVPGSDEIPVPELAAKIDFFIDMFVSEAVVFKDALANPNVELTQQFAEAAQRGILEARVAEGGASDSVDATIPLWRESKIRLVAALTDDEDLQSLLAATLLCNRIVMGFYANAEMTYEKTELVKSLLHDTLQSLDQRWPS